MLCEKEEIPNINLFIITTMNGGKMQRLQTKTPTDLNVVQYISHHITSA